MPNSMNAKQFAWAYMVMHGRANVKPSFYGGEESVDKDVQWVKKNYCKDFNPAFIQMIKEVGVDWDKTGAPHNERTSVFTDTFHDPDDKEYVQGILVLKNGYRQTWMSDTLTSDVFEIMANADLLKKSFAEIFKE